MNVSGNLATEHRLDWLRRQLEDRGQIHIAEAAAHLEVSDMTIRRDLQELEAHGLARRVRGGAVAVGPIAYADRYKNRARAKARISAKLLDLVPETGAIGIDASSTLQRLATAIDHGRDLMVLTNGPETFFALQHKPGVTALVTGGALDLRTGSLVGPVACRSASNLLLSRLFISAAAVDPAFGPSEPCLEEAEVKRAMSAVAGEVVLAVDSSKLGAALGCDQHPVGRDQPARHRTRPQRRPLADYRDLVEIR